MPARKHVAPELVVEGKQLYEETLTPTDEIGARMGLSRSAFYLRVKEWKWERRRYSSSVGDDTIAAGTFPVTQNFPENGETGLGVTHNVTPEQRAALFARVFRASEVQMDTIECIQQTLRPVHAAQSERTGRILATITKTLLEIAAIAKPDETAPPYETDDDPIPRDIDEFRRELARRIRSFIESRRNGAPGLPGPGKSEVD